MSKISKVYKDIESTNIITNSETQSAESLSSDKKTISSVMVSPYFLKYVKEKHNEVDSINLKILHRTDVYGTSKMARPSILKMKDFSIIYMLPVTSLNSQTSSKISLIKRQIFNEKSYAVLNPPSLPTNLKILDIGGSEVQRKIDFSCSQVNLQLFWHNDSTMNIFCHFIYFKSAQSQKQDSEVTLGNIMFLRDSFTLKQSETTVEEYIIKIPKAEQTGYAYSYLARTYYISLKEIHLENRQVI